MTDIAQQERWHLSKAVPVSIIFFLIVQTIGIVIWATRLDSRVAFLEQGQSSQDIRLDKLEVIVAKVAVMDDRQITMMRRLEVQTDKLNQLLGIRLNGPQEKP